MADSPFDLPGQWYRGNLHTHTTESDGARSPADVLDWHAANGYDFVALTDHDRITRADNPPPGLLVLPGAELSLGRTRQGSPLHCVTAGLSVDALPGKFAVPGEGLEWAWGQGAFAYIAHPHWSALTHEELAGLPGVRALEVFNTGCAAENHKGNGIGWWDDLLARGRRVWGVAADDSHFRSVVDYAGGWVMVKVETFDEKAIVASLRAGHFYSTSGPTIQDVRADGNRLWVSTSAATAIYWVGAGRLGWSLHASEGQTVGEAEFEVKGKPSWVRVEVCDLAGRWAWSNPMFLEAA